MKHTYEKFIIKNKKTGEYIVAAPGENGRFVAVSFASHQESATPLDYEKATDVALDLAYKDPDFCECLVFEPVTITRDDDEKGEKVHMVIFKSSEEKGV